MNSNQFQPQSKLKDSNYLKIWQSEQAYTRNRWNITTFFMGVSFAILGFSFQATLTPPASLAIRISGLLIYWFAYFLYLHFYRYTNFLRSYLLEMETSNRVTLDIESKAKSMLHPKKRLSTTHLLLVFGLIYTFGITLLWFLVL